MGERRKIHEAVDLAQRVLKREWEVVKHPWKAAWGSVWRAVVKATDAYS